MPRIKPRNDGSVPLLMRAAYRYAREQYGHVPEPMTVWAHSPGVFWTWSTAETLTHYTWRRLPRHVGELAALRVASTLGCSWCLDFGSLVARFSGVGEDKIRAVSEWRSADRFDADERLALRYADGMTATPIEIDDELVSRITEVFGDDGAVELTAVIALENQRSRFNHALGITAQGFSRDVCAVAVDRDL